MLPAGTTPALERLCYALRALILKLIGALTVVCLLAPTPNVSKRAYACSLAPQPNPRIIRDVITASLSYSEAVTLADIVGHNQVGTGRPLLVPADATTATFSPAAFLYSTGPVDGRTIGPLGYIGPDCSGGPLLETGDKVLLFLQTEKQYRVAEWRVGVSGDTILFQGPEAFYLSPARHLTPAGSSRSVIETLIEITQPSPANREAALAFLAQLERAPNPVQTSTPTPTPVRTLPTSTPQATGTQQGIRPPAAGDAGLK